jgi:hypothetical protein
MVMIKIAVVGTAGVSCVTSLQYCMSEPRRSARLAANTVATTATTTAAAAVSEVMIH